MSGLPVVFGSYEEARPGDRVGLLVDPGAGTEYSRTGVVKRTQRNTSGDLVALVRWDDNWVDQHHACDLIVIEEAS